MALVVLGIPTFKFYTLQAVNCKILERNRKVLRESNLSIKFKLFTIRLFSSSKSYNFDNNVPSPLEAILGTLASFEKCVQWANSLESKLSDPILCR